MKSKVYFVAIKDADDIHTVNEKLKNLIEKSKVLDFIHKDYNAVVKLHFGEEGNTGFVRPEHLRVICAEIVNKGAAAVLSDTNTLYRGKRVNSTEHLALSREHGFTKEAVGVDTVIPDDSKKENIVDIQINQGFIKTAKVVRIFVDADAIIAVSHFKGHILTGFGGALKNIGMGCATRAGKLSQHCDVSPVVYPDKCTGCGQCASVCPVGAIRIENNKSHLDSSKCIGCASCLAVCPTGAMFIDWGTGDKLQEKMVDYSSAILKDKKNKAGFLNFAIRINKECDCWNMENPRIAPDVGILASADPVSIDKASFDLVNKACGKDIFKAAHPEQNGMKQLEYAQEIGLGSLGYELIEIP